MKRIAVMQPYFVPYIGYFQLISAVDEFVIWDDVQYIRKGWINRNRILNQNKDEYLTIPVVKGRQGDLVSEKTVVGEPREIAGKMKKTLEHAYRRAPYFGEQAAFLDELLGALDTTRLMSYLAKSIHALCARLSIPTHLCLSSEIARDDSGLKGGERIMAICRARNAQTYVNPIGGLALYGPDTFRRAGLDLKFLQSHPLVYRQFGAEFVPNLSILDVLMFNPLEAVQKCVKSNYELI